MSGGLELYELTDEVATLEEADLVPLLRSLVAGQAAAREDGMAWVVGFTAVGPFSVRCASVDGWARREHQAYIVTRSGGPAADAATRALARAMDAWVLADAETMRGGA